MRNASCLLIAICTILFVNAQNILKKYVTQNVTTILTIEPDSTDYTDLECIGKAIGTTKIVMLGEQDHGDAPTFLAKTRIIKYLHEKMGFNVLAFESDFFSLNFGFDHQEKSKSGIDSFLKRNIYPIWTYCNTCQTLFNEYIPDTYQTSNPLIITGFDNQLALTYSFQHLKKYIDSLLQSLNIPITRQDNYMTEILPLIDSLKFYSYKESSNFTKCETYLNEIKNQIGDKLKEADFGMQVINCLLSENKEYEMIKSDWIIAGNRRDSQMASNLKWLTEVKFPHEKIIVWAANAHIAKFIDSSGKAGKKMISMGNDFTQEGNYANETYVLGFTSYEGEAGRLGFKTFSVRKPKPNGFENWIPKSANYAFVDFKSFNNLYPANQKIFFLKALGHNTAFEKDWTKVFDGIFFIRDMYPCKR